MPELNPPPAFHSPVSTAAGGCEKTVYDLVVAGATPAGIVCAIRGAREGLRVLLVSHTPHVGGFMTSGAGGWEAPYDGARSPLYDEILRRISGHYRDVYGEDSPQHRASRPDPTTQSRLGRPKVEPRVAELIFEQMLAAEPRLTVLRGFYPAAAGREGRLLRSVTFQAMHGEGAVRISGRSFADCLYEGDLAAVAGVPWRVGREARSDYDESYAGVIFTRERAAGQCPAPRPPLAIRQMGSPHGVEILPEGTGEADASVMAYNFRLILTKDPANRVRVTKPANYDPAALGWAGRSIVPGLPNDKVAWNGAGRLIGPQHGYPTGDWKTREEISRRYLDAAVGRLWFYQHDPAASPEDRAFWQDYGLARDEFPDNGHLPYEVYVREARRIVGRHVFTQHDAVVAPGIERAPIQPDSVAVTDWPLDSVVCTDRLGRNREGAFVVADAWRPAQVPYRTLLAEGVDNLLVPVCLSATHVGWGTIRLEPVWMQTGEAAAYAVALAQRRGVAPALIDPEDLLRTLVEARQMVSFFNDTDLASDDATLPAVQYFGTKGFFATHDARPGEPLTEPFAQAWLSVFQKLLRRDNDFDPTAAARGLPPADAPGAAVAPGEFLARVQALRFEAGLATPPGSFSLPAAPLSRGEACRLLYALLERRAAVPPPCLDLSGEVARQVVVEPGTAEVYQGHVTTTLLPDGQTLYCVWTQNHGGPCGPLKRSDDGGRTWSDLLPVPANWTTVRNCPALYRLTDPRGVARLFIYAGQGPDGTMHQAVSEDGGATWTPMASNGLTAVMPFCTILPVEGGKRLLGLTNLRRPGETVEKNSNLLAQSFSTDGGFTWAPWRIVLDLPGLKPCEPALVRSPDGSQLLCLVRENVTRLSLFITSDDEGMTWSAAKLLPPGLFGDRHMVRQAADGRLVVVFRDTGPGSATHDHYLAWVGHYGDITSGRDGQYRIKLLHSHARWDCGYSGLECLPDGTFVATTYIKYRPGPEKHSIVSTRFTLAETDARVRARSSGALEAVTGALTANP